MRTILVAGNVLLMTCPSATAQEKSTSLLRPCWGKECGSFVLIESGFLTSLSNVDHPDVVADGTYTIDLGGMTNVSDRFAVGGTAQISFGFFDDREVVYPRLSLKPRLRYWIDRRIAVDIAPGIMFVGDPREVTYGTRDSNIDSPAFVTEFGLTFADWFTVVTQLEFLSGRNVRWDGNLGTQVSEDVRTTSVSMGVKFGRYGGIVLTGAFLGLVLLALAAE